MSRYIFLVFFFLSVFPKSFSQSDLGDYSYLLVPEQFEFLNGRDKYQLNSLTKFLLDKQGFNTFMADDMPDARRCDGLFADVVDGKGVFTTKLSVVIKDCKGVEIFRSAEGVSKNKDYKKSYHEALRRAFKSLEGLNVKPKGMVLYTEKVDVEMPIMNKSMPELNIPKTKFLGYSFNGMDYLLRNSGGVFWLYEETNTSSEGLILKGKIEEKGKSGLYFIKSSGGEFKVYFDASESFIIQKGTVSETYKRID